MAEGAPRRKEKDDLYLLPSSSSSITETDTGEEAEGGGDGSGSLLGPFQRKVRNAGIPVYLERIPSQWPHSPEQIEDILLEAGFTAGKELIATAQYLWQQRPTYRRRSKEAKKGTRTHT